MKRFYTRVGTATAADGFAVQLDGKSVRTPARHSLSLPTAALARAVADEWAAQAERIDAASMPLTRLATTVIDLVPSRRADAIEELCGYAGTDLLCYRAAGPPGLAERQRQAWQPWLDWAGRRFDAGLAATDRVRPLAQPEPSLRALRRVVERLDDWRLIGLHAAVTATGSLVLGLAILAGELAADRAFDIAQLDELYEIERWGEIEEHRRRHVALRRDLAAAQRWLGSLGVAAGR